MTPEKTQELVDKYPLLYRHYHNPGPGRFHGFACGEGWFDLIDQLSAKLEPLIAAMPEAERPGVGVVKQKLGGLRFGLQPYVKALHDLVLETDAASYTTCEMCGKTGEEWSINGWLMTACEPCATAVARERGVKAICSRVEREAEAVADAAEAEQP